MEVTNPVNKTLGIPSKLISNYAKTTTRTQFIHTDLQFNGCVEKRFNLGSPWSESETERAFLLFCTQSIWTTKKEGSKTSSFKVRRERMRTEFHSSWIPLWRERRRDGWAGQKRDRRREEKIKQRVRDTRGRERITVNMCLAVSTRKMTEPVVKLALHRDESGWLQMNNDGREQETDD